MPSAVVRMSFSSKDAPFSTASTRFDLVIRNGTIVDGTGAAPRAGEVAITDGRIAALVEYPRNDAHRLIEECMIAANIAAARYLDRNHVPTLYRVHGMPEEDRLETLRQFLREFGLWLPPAGEVTAQHLRDLLQKLGDRPDALLVSTAVIRAVA